MVNKTTAAAVKLAKQHFDSYIYSRKTTDSSCASTNKNYIKDI